MLKAVVFDCFGVLCRDGWLPFRNRYFGHDATLMQQAIDMDHASDAGQLPYSDFLAHIAALAGIDRMDAQTQIEDSPASPEVFAYIERAIKGQYKIGLLSNAAENWLHDLFTPEQLSVFDATALSCEIGFAKPSPEAYQAIAAKLSVALEECVLVDDQPNYCHGAIAAGMQSIQFNNIEQIEAELTKLGIRHIH